MTPARQRPARERLVEAALRQIARDGMTVGLEHVSLERVIERSGVSRATAYRQWPSKAEFLSEVLVRAIHATRLDAESPDDVLRIKALMEPDPQEVLATAQSRRELVVEALRISVSADVERVLASPQWRTYLAISATCQGLPEGRLRRDVTEALAETEARFTRRRAEVYARLPQLIGYRLVPPLHGPEGFEVMASAAGATMTGLAVRAYSRPGMVHDTFSGAAFGARRVAEWTLPTYHLVGVVLSFVEPDPDVVWDSTRIRRTLAMVEELEQLLQSPPR
jgi:AcrR family transcriptional regulator